MVRRIVAYLAAAVPVFVFLSPSRAAKIKQVLTFREFPSASVCRTCHTSIYDQWRASRHFAAWTSPLYRRSTSDYAITGCLGCHAPSHIVGERTPEVRENLLFEGVTCASCHWDSSGVIHGPRGEPAPHPTVRDTTLARAEACKTCHLFGGTYTQWYHGSLGQSGISCQQCHQTTSKAVVADGAAAKVYGLKARQVASHRWPGGSDSLFRASAISVGVRPAESGRSQGIVRITMQNIGAGHALPSGWGLRTIELDLVLRNGRGDSLATIRQTITTADTSHLLPTIPREFERSFGLPIPADGEIDGRLWERVDPSLPPVLMMKQTWPLRAAPDVQIEGW